MNSEKRVKARMLITISGGESPALVTVKITFGGELNSRVLPPHCRGRDFVAALWVAQI